jgi:hypothetical protein
MTGNAMVVHASYSNFTMSGGIIANNTVVGWGGGVHNSGNFSMSNGAIVNNAATDGGGVYVAYSDVTVNGVYVSSGFFSMLGVCDC